MWFRGWECGPKQTTLNRSMWDGWEGGPNSTRLYKSGHMGISLYEQTDRRTRLKSSSHNFVDGQ